MLSQSWVHVEAVMSHHGGFTMGALNDAVVMMCTASVLCKTHALAVSVAVYVRHL